MSNFNTDQGSISFWAKNSLPQPIHHWKLNENPEYTASLTEYVTDTDGNLTHPDDEFDSVSSFIPMNNSAASMVVLLGDYKWGTAGGAVGVQVLTGQDVGTEFGTAKLVIDVGSWDAFVDSSYHGLQRIYFPFGEDDNNLGGYVEFYYDYLAVYTAFYGDSSDAVITLDGSVYKGSVSYENLVVTGGGIVGPAGLTNTVFDIGSSPSHGVNSGALIGQDGYRGKCYLFDDVAGDYVDTLDIGMPDGDSPRTFSAWAKCDDPTTNKHAMAYGTPATAQSFGFMIYTGNTWWFYAHGGAYDFDTGVVADTSWHLHTLIYDGVTSKYYLDGELIGKTDQTLNTTLYGNLTIGARQDHASDREWSGYIEDVRLYDIDLTGDQVKQLYQDTRYLISADSLPAPIHRLPFDKPYLEDIGVLDSTLINNGTTLEIDDVRKGRKLTPDSVGYIDLGNDPNWTISDDFTLMMMVKVDSFPASNAHRIMGNADTTAISPDIDGWALDISDSGSVVFKGADGTAWPTTDLRSDAGYINVGQWHHITITLIGTTGKIYVDGVEVTYTAQTANGNGITLTSLNLEIGRVSDYNNDGLDGVIADLRLYAGVLTPLQVQAIANERETFELKIDKKVDSIKSSVNENIKNGLVLWNKLGSAQEVQRSEVGVNGVIDGTPSYSPCKFGNGLTTTGSGNAVDFTMTGSPMLKGTVEIWVKPNWDSTSDDYHWIVDARVAYANRIGVYWRDGMHTWALNIAGDFIVDSSVVPHAIGDLIHVVAVWDADGIDGTSDTCRMYIDGSMTGNTSNAIPTSYTFEGFRIGATAVGEAFDGTIDNFKVWNYAKTDFSDRFEEYPTHIMKPMQQYWWGDVREPNGLLLWNKLGSVREVQNSIVGPNLIPINTPVFVEGKFGSGYEIGPKVTPIEDRNAIDVPADVFTTDYFTIEFWIKKVVANIPDDTYGYEWWHGNLGDNDIGFTMSNLASGGRYGPYCHMQDTTSSEYAIWKYNYGTNAALNAAFPQNVWKHVAWVFDSDEAAGADRMKIYVDGVLLSMSVHTGDGIFPTGGSNPGGTLALTGYTNPNPVTWNMDNLKIWNYAKTDFSDRYNESPRGLILKPGSIDLHKWSHVAMAWKHNDLTTPADAEGLLLWNKLGSLTEIENSEVGANGSVTSGGTPEYSPVKYGDGVEIPEASKGIEYSQSVSMEEGCYECWVKMRYDIDEDESMTLIGTTLDAYPYARMYYSHSSNELYFSMTISATKYVSIRVPVSYIGYTTSGFICHIAVTWNFTRGSGVISSAEEPLRMYINGSRPSDAQLYSSVGGSATYADFQGPTQTGIMLSGCANLPWPTKVWMDNFKYWNYEKTDFSDRNYEAPQEVNNKIYYNGSKVIDYSSPGLLKAPYKHAIIGSDTNKRQQSGVLYDKIAIGNRQLDDHEVYNMYLSETVK